MWDINLGNEYILDGMSSPDESMISNHELEVAGMYSIFLVLPKVSVSRSSEYPFPHMIFHPIEISNS